MKCGVTEPNFFPKKFGLNFKLWWQTRQEQPRTVGNEDAISAQSDTE
jgi:hypothetical protein